MPPVDGPPPLTAFAWRNGLVRPVHGRLLSGVCGAFGRATHTDPILWRVILAVLSLFGGVGVLIYVLGWLLLPADGDTASPVESILGRGRSATSPTLTVIAGAVVLLSVGVFFSEPFRPGPWGIVLVAGAVLLLVRERRGRRMIAPAAAPPPAPPTVPPYGTVPYATAPYGTVAYGTAAYATAAYGTAGAGPVAGGPYGPGYPAGPVTAPFAPYGPFAPTAPAPMPPPMRRQRSRLTRLVLSVALIVMGGLALFDYAGHSVPGGVYVATALTVVGLGLVVGGWYGRGRGLVGVGIVLCLLLGAASAVGRSPLGGTSGTVTWVPQTVSQIEPSYTHELGNGTLDLSHVDFSEVKAPVLVEVRLDLGNLEVIVPPTVDVTIDSTVDAGNATIFGQSFGGLNAGPHTTTDLGSDGPGGGTLHLTVSVNLGNVEVHR